MIGYLNGVVRRIAEDHVIVDVQGVGYLVYCPGRVLARLGAIGAPVELHVETQVREDAITLYGFDSDAERAWFKRLQQIQGVGARMALALLGTLAPDALARAVAAQDRAALTQAPGVGPKLATRILAELKDKLAALPVADGLPAVQLTAAAVPIGTGVLDDAVSALAHLGYGRSEAFAAAGRAQQALGEAAPLEAILREALRELSPS
ncbi:MAG: Holliday junction branch migration protein RuvA [Geminicoccaceae bacterium]